MHFIYFAKSLKNNKIYVGRSAKDPNRRVDEHNQGSNNWTRQNGPFKLVYYESFLCKDDSLKKEDFYKTGIGKNKKSNLPSNGSDRGVIAQLVERFIDIEEVTGSSPVNSTSGAQFRPEDDRPWAEARALH